MQTQDTTTGAVDKSAVGEKATEGVGFGVMFFFNVEQKQESEAAQTLKFSTAYGSTSKHDYSFTFDFDFSTSSDPNIAGHPSDIIVGGGIDIYVGEATQGKLQQFNFL